MTLSGTACLIHPEFDTPPSNPIAMFKSWLANAERLQVSEPYGLVLCTVNNLGVPSSRVVLIKEIDDASIIFYTSAESEKAKDLESNSMACGTLWWRETVQQINFQGTVQKLLEVKLNQLFKQRPRTAQAVAAFSKQSACLLDEQNLTQKALNLIDSNESIERPAA